MAKAKSTTEPTSAETPFATLAAAVSPQWGETILRLTQATDRLSSQFDQFVGAKTKADTVKACRELTQELINFLDEIGGDTDQDSAVDDDPCDTDELERGEGDEEPSLGFLENHPHTTHGSLHIASRDKSGSQLSLCQGKPDDLEEQCEDEGDTSDSGIADEEGRMEQCPHLFQTSMMRVE